VSDALADAAPRDVLLEELYRSGEGSGAGRRGARNVVGDLGVGDGPPRPAERAERDGARDGEQVHGQEQRRCVPRQESGEQEQRRGHQTAPLVQRNPPDAQDRGEREHERRREEPRVHAERPAVEEQIAEDPQADGAEDETDGCPFTHGHRRDASRRM
jgi:hypothetical protein